MTQELYQNAREAMELHIERFRTEILSELRIMSQAQDASKDILIVVHNQLDFIRNCINSIRKVTKNYCLLIWNNDSDDDTTRYLNEEVEYGDIKLYQSSKNLGFGEPNNCLASESKSDYLILLNSDTQVFEGWDRAMIGHLQANPQCGQVGYLGCLLDEKGFGGRAVWGSEIDYVSGFCSCISKETYNKFGLFDPAYKFAYCEDADFSLRLQHGGLNVYALHLILVHHFENQTIKAVVEEGEIDTMRTFLDNHEILRNRWAEYLSHHRVDLRKDSPHVIQQIQN